MKANPTDVASVAGLIMSYSEFDPALAERYQEYLPYDEQILEVTEIDVEGLETLFTFGRLGGKKAVGVGGNELS